MSSYGERAKGSVRGDMRNCRRCGKVFISFGSPICPECIRKEEQQYELVRKYLRENPNMSVSEVSENTGVAPELIMEFLRKGLLIGLPDSGVSGKSMCIICKKPLDSGRICPQCQKALLGVPGAATDGPAYDTSAEPPAQGGKVKRVSSDTRGDSGTKMYIIDMIRKKK